MDAQLRIGVDLGGTKTECVVTRLPADVAGPRDGPEVLSRVRLPTLASQGYDHVLDTVVQAISESRRQAGLSGRSSLLPIGVGMPGNVTYGRPRGSQLLVKNSNTTCLNGRPFRDDLIRRLGQPVRFANDANCFALAEARCGAARGASVVFGVILGTGVGGGVVWRGPAGPTLWDGVQGIAGEWGHVALEPRDGPQCYCGRRGCVEKYLSGPAIEAAYEQRSGRRLPLAEIAGRGDDPDAQAVLSEVAETFGRALSMVIDILDPEVIVLGGGVSNLAVLYQQGVAAVARWIFNDELATRIVQNQLGDSAGVIGAALLWP